MKGGKMIESKNYLKSRSRTKVHNEWNFRSTFSAGSLFPIYAREIYPSMNDSINCAELVRSITPLGPTMDNSFLDIFFFFVPNRLLWDHWEEFIAGYNKEAWAQDVEYTVPQIIFKTINPEGEDVDPTDYNIYLHSFLDYLPNACDVVSLYKYQLSTYGKGEIAIKSQLTDRFSISALYPRAYCKIWNDWFRDENVQDELELYTGDNDEYADEFAFNLLSAESLPKANKFHNRFTSALPAPVKGPDVLIPMNNLQLSGTLPVGSFFEATGTGGTSGLVWTNTSGTPSGSFGQAFVNNLNNKVVANASTSMVANNVSNTIRMLRLATQTELLLARDARGGTRYTESILSHFGVHNGDARLQRAEYLGSRSIPLNIQQITNTSQAGDNALGNVGGQSVTKDSSFYFSKAFSEWGIVIGLACVRTNISYSSGRHKQYARKGRFDFIWPEFKHIGDVPLYTTEFWQGKGMYGLPADTVFGYTPYGSELRTGMNYNNGLFRNKADGNLSYLTYQEDYSDADGEYPELSSEWMEQSSSVVSNTLIDQVGPQFYALFKIDEQLVIPLDPTSDPGLMDHF